MLEFRDCVDLQRGGAQWSGFGMERGAEWEWASTHFGLWRFQFVLYMLNNRAFEEPSIAKARV